MVTGSLLGFETNDGVLEITHAFPFPDKEDDDYQLEMMRMLREVNVDNNCVGWYQSMYLGSYSTTQLLESQISYQTELSQNAVVVLYDPMQTTHGDLCVKCLRVTDECLQQNNTNQFVEHIFEQVPMQISNPGLVRALLVDIAPSTSTSLDRLDLSTGPYLEKNMEFLGNWVDELSQEQLKFQFYAKKSMGHAKTEQAPKRMESLLISNQIHTYCDQVNKFAEDGFSKLFLAGGLHQDKKM
jgi:translation initiation factor 3 subunit H